MDYLSSVEKEANRKVKGRGLVDFAAKLCQNPSLHLKWSYHFISSLIYYVFGEKFYTKIDNNQIILYAALHHPRRCVFYSDTWEYNVSALFCSLLDEGMIVVDVGAGLGYYALLAVKRVGRNGLVIAFEPDPARFKILTKNIRANNCQNVEAFQYAISNSNTKVKMFSSPFQKEYVADAVSLDRFFKRTPDVIKIDVEGGELDVLKGMKEMLKREDIKIICEVHPRSLSSKGQNPIEISRILRELNYKIYLIKGWKLFPINEFKNKREHYFFVKGNVNNLVIPPRGRKICFSLEKKG